MQLKRGVYPQGILPSFGLGLYLRTDLNIQPSKA